jgi:hypothetical protein
MTAATDPGRVVAWQYRSTTGTRWQYCNAETQEKIHTKFPNEYELRALIPESLLAEAESLAADRLNSMSRMTEAMCQLLDENNALQAQVDAVRELAEKYEKEAARHLIHTRNKEWAEWVRADHASRASELNGATTEIRAALGESK